jgi:hypothetical protein
MTEFSPSTSALAKATPPPPPATQAADISSGVFSGIAAFEAAQRMAQALCTSTMVPSDYRGQQGLSNSLIALEIAARMRLSPLVVMQNMTPIHGKPSWSSSFLIATVNASGRFSPLRFVFDDKNNPSSCFAVARDKATGEVLEGQTISIEMAKQEGWWSRPDRYGKETSKWQSMTGQMLRYRAAAFWVKVYCPEISLGLMTQEEVSDVQAVEASAVEPVATPQVLTRAEPMPTTRPAAMAPVVVLPAENGGTAGSATATEAGTSRRSPRRSTAAHKQADPQGQPNSDEPQQAALATEPAREPNAPSKQPAHAELVDTALEEIPKLGSTEALDNARQRVNRLLAEGQLSDEGAERLWALIDRRLQQLVVSSGATEPQRVS